MFTLKFQHQKRRKIRMKRKGKKPSNNYPKGHKTSLRKRKVMSLSKLPKSI